MLQNGVGCKIIELIFGKTPGTSTHPRPPLLIAVRVGLIFAPIGKVLEALCYFEI
jgi:hypothetical protein